jgi:hypothetical protein
MQEQLASLTTKSIAQGVEVDNLTKRTADFKSRVEQLQTQLAQVQFLLCPCVRVSIQLTRSKHAMRMSEACVAHVYSVHTFEACSVMLMYAACKTHMSSM